MRNALLAMLLSITFLLLACGSPPPVVNDEDFPAMGRAEATLSVDGSVEGYPERPAEVMGMEVHMAHDGDSLYVHLRADIDGWVAVGFNARGGGMDGANMILGYLEGEAPVARDDVGRGRTHSEATTASLEEYVLLSHESERILEFSYPLAFPEDVGYRLERVVPGETYTLLVAYHEESDDVGRRHSHFATLDFVVVP